MIAHKKAEWMRTLFPGRGIFSNFFFQDKNNRQNIGVKISKEVQLAAKHFCLFPQVRMTHRNAMFFVSFHHKTVSNIYFFATQKFRKRLTWVVCYTHVDVFLVSLIKNRWTQDRCHQRSTRPEPQSR